MLGWFVRWKAGNHRAVVLKGAATRIYSKQHISFLCSSHQAFFSMCIVRAHVVHQNSCTEMAIILKKFYQRDKMFI